MQILGVDQKGEIGLVGRVGLLGERNQQADELASGERFSAVEAEVPRDPIELLEDFPRRENDL